MNPATWILLVVLLLAPFVVARAVNVASYRRERAQEAERWRGSWASLAAARSLRLEPMLVSDLNGGCGFRQTWWTLNGSVASVPYCIGLGIITYGYDGLLMLQAAVGAPPRAQLVLAPHGRNPLDKLPPIDPPTEPADGLELCSDDPRAARALVTKELHAAVADIPDAMLIVRGTHVQLVLPTTAEDLDLALLDKAVHVLALLVRNIENMAPG